MRTVKRLFLGAVWLAPLSLAGAAPLYERVPAPTPNPIECAELVAAFNFVLKDLRESSDPYSIEELRQLLEEPSIAADPAERARIAAMMRFAFEDQRMLDEVQTQFPNLWRQVENHARRLARGYLGDRSVVSDLFVDWEPPGEFGIVIDGATRVSTLSPELPTTPPSMQEVWARSGANIVRDLVDLRVNQLVDQAHRAVADSAARQKRRMLLTGKRHHVETTAHVVFHQTSSLQEETARRLEALAARASDPIVVIPDYSYHERLVEPLLFEVADLVRPNTGFPGLYPALQIEADHFVFYGGDFDPWMLSSFLRELIKPSLDTRRRLNLTLSLDLMYGLFGRFVSQLHQAEFNYDWPEVDEEERYQNVRAVGPWLSALSPAERASLLRKLSVYLIDPMLESETVEVLSEVSAADGKSHTVVVSHGFLYADEEKELSFCYQW